MNTVSTFTRSTGGPLMYRIQRLTGVAEYQPAPKASAALAAGLAMVCFLMNGHWAKAQGTGKR